MPEIVVVVVVVGAGASGSAVVVVVVADVYRFVGKTKKPAELEANVIQLNEAVGVNVPPAPKL